MTGRDRARAVRLFVAATALCAPATAAASSTWTVAVDPGPPPRLAVTVAGALAADGCARCTLGEDAAELPDVRVAPAAVVPFRAAGHRLALVVLVEGHGRYLGDGAAPGVGGAIAGALDGDATGALRDLGDPRVTQAALIVYGDGAQVRRPLGPIGRLTGAALREPAPHRALGRDLDAGLTAAYDVLVDADAAVRVLVIIGDGYYPGARSDVRAHKQRFDASGIEVFALGFANPAGAPLADPIEARWVMRTLGDGPAGAAYRIASEPELRARLADVVARVNGRVTLVFPRTAGGPSWDGRPHALQLFHDGAPVGPRQVAVLPAVGGAVAAVDRAPWRRRAVLVAAGLAALLGVVLVRHLGRAAPG